MTEFSTYQLAIFDFLLNQSGSLVIDASAGSGKTFTIKHGAAKLIERGNRAMRMIAFNTTIKSELLRVMAQYGLGSKDIKTVHGLGWQALFWFSGNKPPQLNDKKYRSIADSYWNQTIYDQPQHLRENLFNNQKQVMRDIFAVHNNMRYDFIKPQDDNAIQAMFQKRGIYPQFEEFTIAGARYLLKVGTEQYERTNVVDFTDMVYLPLAIPGMSYMKSPLIFVDEAQDLSAMSLELILRSIALGGRFIFVGDPNQAIYAFAGADAESFNNIIKRTGATLLPLSVNYRCGKNIIELAQRIVPKIQAHEGAIDGTVDFTNEKEMILSLENDPKGNLIVCRLTAPLISLCIRLIRKGIGAKVKGRSIGRELIEIIDGIVSSMGEQFSYVQLKKAVGNYSQAQAAYLFEQGASLLVIDSAIDRCEAIITCIDACPSHDLSALKDYINSLFEDAVSPKEYLRTNPTMKHYFQGVAVERVLPNGYGAKIILVNGEVIEVEKDGMNEEMLSREIIWLSTIHKAKGLEENRVYIIAPDKLPFTYLGQSESEYQQEKNLAYVAITRAKSYLGVVGKFNMDILNPPSTETSEKNARKPSSNGIQVRNIALEIEKVLNSNESFNLSGLQPPIESEGMPKL